jgi:hypothetical protein
MAHNIRLHEKLDYSKRLAHLKHGNGFNGEPNAILGQQII